MSPLETSLAVLILKLHGYLSAPQEYLEACRRLSLCLLLAALQSFPLCALQAFMGHIAAIARSYVAQLFFFQMAPRLAVEF